MRNAKPSSRPSWPKPWATTWISSASGTGVAVGSASTSPADSVVGSTMEMLEVGSSAASWSFSVVVSPQAMDAITTIASTTTGTTTCASLGLLI